LPILEFENFVFNNIFKPHGAHFFSAAGGDQHHAGCAIVLLHSQNGKDAHQLCFGEDAGSLLYGGWWFEL
jgi:hypothetical protein